ncbi:hypothetical protein [Croceicoccus gelatinilyticus]|uniref:hypothetical protein n=1 Tax=Croceicoccus gelatinilyticus TaxID=2835536 RepID=UPI001BD03188|nr:hypothetical protein [Croceicoccus gelatinilyticus]MBS7671383.1 hypothetical protein [Croceicoccus gelatinilyticus]
MHTSPNHLEAVADAYARKSERENGGLPFAFIAVLPQDGEMVEAVLGVAQANQQGYSPVPAAWAHGTYAEMNELCDELNAKRLTGDMAIRIIASTMNGQRFTATAT